jgi:hypothetical protein
MGAAKGMGTAVEVSHQRQRVMGYNRRIMAETR